MIVKLVLHKDQRAFSIWDRDGKRLYWSDQPKDLKLCRELLTIQHPPQMAGDEPTQSLASHSYFNAKWVKGIVTMVKRAQGYNW